MYPTHRNIKLVGRLSLIAAAAILLSRPTMAVDFYVTSTADLADVSPGDGVCDADAGAPAGPDPDQ